MLKIIVAMDDEHGIGLNGFIPWRCLEDLYRFKEFTLNQLVVMGRKTYDTLPVSKKFGEKLYARSKLILTHNKNYGESEELVVKHSVQDVLTFVGEWQRLHCSQDVYVIGGAEIYKEFLVHCDELLITRISGIFGCDAFFPKIDLNEWELKFQKRTKEAFYETWHRY